MWGDKCVTMRRKLFDVYPFVPFDFGINDCIIYYENKIKNRNKMQLN